MDRKRPLQFPPAPHDSTHPAEAVAARAFPICEYTAAYLAQLTNPAYASLAMKTSIGQLQGSWSIGCRRNSG
jgi:hypothetical protein